MKTKIIAEIGINHNGSLDTAFELINIAKTAGFDYVKFQKRTPELCVPEAQKGIMKDTPWGRMTYMDYKNKIEFKIIYIYYLKMSYLEIIMGPMFSGKTEMLINIYNTYSLISKPHNILLSTTFCIAFNYHKDTRYGENIIASHNKKSIPSINIEFQKNKITINIVPVNYFFVKKKESTKVQD